MYDRWVRGIGRLLGVLAAALIFLGASEGASAATLKANYQLQGNLISEVAGAPNLSDLGTGNRFAFETVDGAARQVLTFPKGNGLSLGTTGLVDARNHSVVMLFRLAEVSRYRRLIDFSNGASDNGLYNLFGRAVLYMKGNVAESPGIVFDDSYVQVALTSAAAAGSLQQTEIYVNGVPVASAKASEGFSLESGMLRFFKDNVDGPGTGEESAGAVACILVYDGALTASEVSEVAGDRALCPAPKTIPGQVKAQVIRKPRLRRIDGLALVNTGLLVRCPIGTTSCSGSGQVDAASTGGRASARRVKQLGRIRFSVQAGESRNVIVPLSRKGIKALREAGELRIRVSTKIVSAEGRKATAQQVGRIRAPRPRAFRPGAYSGTTSQGLPIFIGVGRTSIRSFFFRWRARCDDGQVHTSSVLLRGAPVSRGRFSFDTSIDSGGSAHVSGKIRGVRASGTLSRTGPTAFGAKCTVRGVRWHARVSGIEADPSP
jgi:hypothetical protein